MDIQKTALRLPRDLHDMVVESSRQFGRSMNAEIVARLRASFDSCSINLNFEVNEKINSLDKNPPFTEAQEARLREVILEMMGK